MEEAQIKELIRNEIHNNMEISVYVHNGRAEVELYWDDEMISQDSISMEEYI